MLPLQKCRDLLGNGRLTDEEVERLRDQLYMLANVAVDSILRHKRRLNAPSKSGDANLQADVSVLEDRAAIVEIEGGHSLNHEEESALADYLRLLPVKSMRKM